MAKYKDNDSPTLFPDEDQGGPQGPVECLGMTFENDDKRREYFLEKLREKLKDPEFRKIEGFPIGEDEDILALSDPPYYTACPNPFIQDFIKHHGKPYDPDEPYSREPFAADVSEGKNDPIYIAHSYHTKVPHKAIMRYILHYTEPGDVVFDGFCGTGMTGVAAQLCGDIKTVEQIGYMVDNENFIIKSDLDENGKNTYSSFSKLGVRRAILNDISPIATFISYNYNSPADRIDFEREAKSLIDNVKSDFGWMFETNHTDGKSKGIINYAVWSDVFVCPNCAGEMVFWNVAVDEENGTVRSSFECPSCNSKLTKRALDRAYLTFHDSILGTPIKQAKQVPVLYNYTVAGRTYTKKPDNNDFDTLAKIDKINSNDWFPSDRMPKGDESRRNDAAGITHTHHFYTNRNRLLLSRLLNIGFSPMCKWLVTGVMQRASKQHQIAISRIGGPKKGVGGATAGHRRGTLYIPSNQVEFNPILLYLERLKMALKALNMPLTNRKDILIETASVTETIMKPNSIDYIFTDPPFGGNIMYSELNFIWESVLKIKTNSIAEAITNKSQKKALNEYQDIMYKSFRTYYFLLKPGRWITIEFHNSQNSVWAAIQEALQKAKFVIADVRVIDKKIKTHTQRTAGGSVNKDLAITAYKPNDGIEERFALEAGTEDGVWDFVRTHMKQLPVYVMNNNRIEANPERQNYMLFDRMVAFHVQRGVIVPISASSFYEGLLQRFPERDSMFFLPDQVSEYDKKRTAAKDVSQLNLFVSDEESSIQWLRQLLIQKPQTFQDIHPQFLKEIGGWQKHEKPLELSEMLRENFLRYDGKGDVPSQIHSYLSTQYKDMRKLPKDSPELRHKAKDRWYVPDPGKAGDLEKLRENALLREFWEYLPPGYKPAAPESPQAVLPGFEAPPAPVPRGKKMKVIRLEAVRAGFKHCWQNKDYRTIIAVAQRIPETALQEDAKLLMWYDQALTREGLD
jgi:DNA modification methylase